jgi:hypothetical protein
MANTVLSTTYQAHSAKGLREDLENVIYDISPTNTPFMSTVGRVKCSAVLHEWQTDSLAAVDTGNKQIEGVNITEFAAVAPSTRVGNYCQISNKVFSVSGTLEAVSKAGRASELAFQAVKKAKELKRDMEAIALENIGASAGSTSAARQMATLGAWIKTNTNISSTGSGDPVYTSGVPAAARTDGTTRALSETLFKNVCQKIYSSGGDLTLAMFGPINKQNASKFTGIATKYQQFDAAKEAPMPTIGASDVYVSDFGTIRIVANRFQRERDGWLLDPEYLAFGYLRPFHTVQLAKTGDAENRLLQAEWTLVVKNEAAHGIIADLNSTVQ